MEDQGNKDDVNIHENVNDSNEPNEQTSSSSDVKVETEPSLESQLADMNSKYLYAMAELDNTRKRHVKERSDLLKYAGENMARDLLEVLDDLERAASQSADTDSNTILEGINLISNRMRTLFERYGIKAEESLGMQFDPKKHEALTMAPSSPDDSGRILQQISRCYFFKDKLLRPAQVIVGNGESVNQEESSDS